ncbi:MAG TPA: low molecular weight phosphotyrosine protein phosphatase [Candidatus Aquabacterium excrementipullorum]|nr:low molecular weight phosphotyrosine protein phosphatase [Candidatus Aquabacterium excrementipullorum]
MDPRTNSRTSRKPFRVLMVCMGNICRSPTAEAVLRHQLQRAGMAALVEVDSAGTHGYHVGSPPDPRSQEHAALRGYDLSTLRARQVNTMDFRDFDLLVAMDADNLAMLRHNCPEPFLGSRLVRLLDFLPGHSTHAGKRSVPDPYYGGADGFGHVLDLVESACEGLVDHLRERLAQVRA